MSLNNLKENRKNSTPTKNPPAILLSLPPAQMLGVVAALLCAVQCSIASPIAYVGTPAFDGVVRPQADNSSAAYMIPPYKSNHASTIEVLPDGALSH